MVLALGLRTHKTSSITGADSNPRRRELTLSGSGAVRKMNAQDWPYGWRSLLRGWASRLGVGCKDIRVVREEICMESE